jgi:hypothetical protein
MCTNSCMTAVTFSASPATKRKVSDFGALTETQVEPIYEATAVQLVKIFT